MPTDTAAKLDELFDQLAEYAGESKDKQRVVGLRLLDNPGTKAIGEVLLKKGLGKRTAITGYPNLFMLCGPNTGLGHNSMVYMIESQLEHVMCAMRAMRDGGAETVEVRPDVAARFNEELDERHKGTVWTTGCSSWYLDDTGRNATLWPDWTWRFRQRTARFDPAAYELRAKQGDRARAPAPA